MKSALSFLLLVLALLTLSIASCKKNDGYMNNAVITGFDNRMVDCNGTFFIHIFTSADTTNFITYDCDNTPASLGITGQAAFPIHLKVNWKPVGYCGYEKILITSYAYN